MSFLFHYFFFAPGGSSRLPFLTSDSHFWSLIAFCVFFFFSHAALPLRSTAFLLHSMCDLTPNDRGCCLPPNHSSSFHHVLSSSHTKKKTREYPYMHDITNCCSYARVHIQYLHNLLFHCTMLTIRQSIICVSIFVQEVAAQPARAWGGELIQYQTPHQTPLQG